MAIFGETVTLVNRTSKVLNARFDGRDQTIQPGENPGFPKIAVAYAKSQNVLMGSEDPENPSPSGMEYLVGVKATPQRDDISPIEQSDAPQRYNRESLRESYLPKSKEVVRKTKINAHTARVGTGTQTLAEG
jgi:hypothetical protein